MATFFAYNLLAMGAFLAYYSLYQLWDARDSRAGWRALLRTSGLALGTYAGLYAALWLATGYNPFAALQRSMARQAVFAAILHRAYGPFVVLDVYDFSWAPASWHSRLCCFTCDASSGVGTAAGPTGR